jgi:GNAT superfamily N-acetyltransferase
VPWKGEGALCVRRCGPEDAEALCDWCDVNLAGDYFFRRGHMRGICSRATSEVWAAELDGLFIGFLIIYRGAVLHNLYLAAPYRRSGIGRALLAEFQPRIVRAKTNMLGGDPVEFYRGAGYEVTGRDARLRHIITMARKDGDPVATQGTALKTDAQDRAGTIPMPAGNPQPGTIGGNGKHPPGGAASRAAAAVKPAPLSPAAQAALADKVRALPDATICALFQTGKQFRRWQERQRAARIRRLERLRAQDAERASVHLDGVEDQQERARLAQLACNDLLDGTELDQLAPHSE